METALLLLRKIGMRSSYAGFNYLACAVALVFEHQEYLRKVTKNLYVMVGKEYGVSNVCVEAAIRTLITCYWNQNEDKILAPILGYPLFEKPTSSEFISILADFLRDHPDFGEQAKTY